MKISTETYLIILNTSALALIGLIQVEQADHKIDSISERLDCIPYQISQQFNKPYNKGISLACLEEVK